MERWKVYAQKIGRVVTLWIQAAHRGTSTERLQHVLYLASFVGIAGVGSCWCRLVVRVSFEQIVQGRLGADEIGVERWPACTSGRQVKRPGERASPR
jgi:hypothetical protein